MSTTVSLNGCKRHRRYWAKQAYIGSDVRGEHWVIYCPCGIPIGHRWYIKARNEWEWARP